jgi:transposase
MQVIIGVDPHKGSHTAVAISAGEDELAHKKVRACRTQVEQLLAWAEPFPTRTWAIEGADGMGYLLAQQLIATGEHVLTSPRPSRPERGCWARAGPPRTTRTTLASVAVTALRTTGLRQVQPVGHSEVLRLLAKRNTDIGNQRTRLVCRMHALLLELDPGGISKEINASDVDRFLLQVDPATPAEQLRYDLAVEL